MSFLYSGIPFEIFTIICIATIPLGIYGAWETERRTPGHPGKWLSLSMCLVGPALWLARYADEYSASDILQKIADIAVPIIAVGFLVGIFVTAFVADKKGYGNHEKMKELKSMLLPLAVIFAVCIVGILVLHRM